MYKYCAASKESDTKFLSKFFFKHSDNIASIASPAPTLSTTFDANATEEKYFLEFAESKVDPWDPWVTTKFLILEFNRYGVLTKKGFYDKESMKKINFARAITENDIRKENFVYSFLSSVRQKMESKKK